MNRQARRIVDSQLTDRKKSRRTIVQTIKGKYAHIRTSSEDFSMRKQTEIQREEKHS